MSLDLPCGGGSGTRGALKWDAAGCREAVSSRARAKQVKDETRPKRLRDLVLGVALEYPLNTSTERTKFSVNAAVRR